MILQTGTLLELSGSGKREISARKHYNEGISDNENLLMVWMNNRTEMVESFFDSTADQAEWNRKQTRTSKLS